MSTPEPKNTLKNEINTTIKILAKKMTETDDSQVQLELSELIGSLMAQRSKLALKILESETEPFKDAIIALEKLTEEAIDAKKDIDKIEKMIANASKTVDKITQFIAGLAKVVAVVA